MGIVSPHLWYHSQAEEAAQFYTSLIPNSEVTRVIKAPPGVNVPEGTAFIVEFTLDGMPVTALSAGPAFTLDESFSMIIACESQEEVDHYWDALLADGGEPSQCGWLKDRFGLSWQVVPTALESLLFSDDTEASARATQAMYTMQKLDLPALQAAYDGV
ncbi:VOC family protein [Cellulomonas cellasea]|uniref:VOC family protein n=1 Tax=Cellulomonas cellasea TaxID=43670 RepID=UPI0025A396C7|nr:VOC family protein [Cellulomonas cellasea]MDM8086509.1 VOC family protein [Cellulomonas cellasea]